LSGLHCTGKLYLLVGGDGKGADFSPLAPVLANLPVELCCFGADGDKFMPLHPSAKRFERMEDVIEQISAQLQSGDMVMLSPACASFDQFSNFMARGDRFAELARQYA
jgi:UDP-N-acetylmuramoylalanine--D-glutamate ligase